MIDLDRLPRPDDSPPPGACIRLERPEPELAVVVLAPPHRDPALLDLPLMRDLFTVLDELETSPELRGVVFTGRTPTSFAAGADLDVIESLSDKAVAGRVVELGQHIFARIEGLRSRGIMTVAAVGGPVPGGAFELALACERIVLADDPTSRIGLPEVRLGILPGWGGCQRLPRRIGVPAALEAILRGHLYSTGEALRIGLVDRLTPPEYLSRVAAEIALGRRRCGARAEEPMRKLRRWLIDRNPPLLLSIAALTRRRLDRRTGGHYPAAPAAARLVTWALLKPVPRGLAGERKAVSKLIVGEVCGNLVGLFRQHTRARKVGTLEDGTPPLRIERAAVIGAGRAGSSIAGSLAEQGIATRLFDLSPAALDGALGTYRHVQARRRLEPHRLRSAIDHLDTTSEWGGFARTQLALEAVDEELAVKRDLFVRLAQTLPPEAILATSTSTLSIAEISEGIPNAGRVVGMHVPGAARKMPLIEIVRTDQTTKETVATAAALALELGKTPLIVSDTPGFLIHRLLCLYLDEALRLYAGGLDLSRLEGAAISFGMSMGPLRLLDEIGLDTFANLAKSLHEAYGEGMQPCAVLDPLIDAGHLGRKSGDGFYVHLSFAPKAPPRFSSDLPRLTPPTSSHEEFLSDDEIVSRLLLPMVNEAARCLEEGVVDDAGLLDLATVLGIGFPPFRGGLLRWANSLGAEEVLDRFEHCATAIATAPKPARRGRFEVAEALRDRLMNRRASAPRRAE
jgi:3-hydroxyacyl-CoA dehydrogenase / enoyl-CoA hydratase / 3-hydroxybutyryl-CoA epimerase